MGLFKKKDMLGNSETKIYVEEQPMQYGPRSPVGYRRFAKTIIKEEQPFNLRPNEHLALTTNHVQYRGRVAMMNKCGEGLMGKGLFRSLYSSKQQKSEDPINGKLCKVYLTNERIIFVLENGKKVDFTNDIPLNIVQSVASKKVQNDPTLQLSIARDNGIENIFIVYHVGQGDDEKALLRAGERDRWIQRIEELRQKLIQSTAIPSQSLIDVQDPIKVLQLRLVKGEITPQQYEEMKMLLIS